MLPVMVRWGSWRFGSGSCFAQNLLCQYMRDRPARWRGCCRYMALLSSGLGGKRAGLGGADTGAEGAVALPSWAGGNAGSLAVRQQHPAGGAGDVAVLLGRCGADGRITVGCPPESASSPSTRRGMAGWRWSCSAAWSAGWAWGYMPPCGKPLPPSGADGGRVRGFPAGGRGPGAGAAASIAQ